MIKEIKAYETIDGARFFSLDEAKKHEKEYYSLLEVNKAKFNAFAYFKKSLSKYGNYEDNKIKIFVFLILSVSKNLELLKIFDNFEAHPLGIFEKDLDNGFNEGDYTLVSDDNKALIDAGLENLEKENPGIFEYPSFDLVSLIKKSTAYRICYDMAISHNAYVEKIPNEIFPVTNFYYR